MQVGKIDNTPSFGINSIKFSNKLAKEGFAEKMSQIPYKKMEKMLQKIKNIKPKNGPDIDTFISCFGGSVECKVNDKNLFSTLYKKTFLDVDKITPKSIINGFKNLVKKVDDEYLKKYVDIKTIPDNLLSKIK